jgi:hypothetical protein
MAGEVARRRALAEVIEIAHGHRRSGQTTLDGHFWSGVRELDGLRLSGRFNRHGRFELSVSRIDRQPVERAVIEQLSLAHAEVQGQGLAISYSDPRDSHLNAGRPLSWAVLQPRDEDAQPALFGVG